LFWTLQRGPITPSATRSFSLAVLFIDIRDWRFSMNHGARGGRQLIIESAPGLKTICATMTPFRSSTVDESAEPAAVEILARLDGDQFTVLLESIKERRPDAAWPCDSRKASRRPSLPTG